MSSVAAEPTWLDVLFDPRDAGEVWTAIFDRLRDLALAAPNPTALHQETVVPDRLLAEAAWNLWGEFPSHAPSVIDELKQFWVSASAVGTAVLILDGLSLRELSPLVTAMRDRQITPTRMLVRAAEVPTETDRFAAALGVAGRYKLANNQPPSTFIFNGPDVYCDVPEQAPFADCAGSVPATPRLFLWHTWPDEDLVHHYADNPHGPVIVAEETGKQLAGDDFWAFADRMRRGRRLVITSDHGYATSKWFSKVTDDDSVKLLRQVFGAKRCARENPDSPWPRRHLPPLVSRHNGWLTVMGQRKWDVQGGFPHLCHCGLTLLEAAVPFVELPPL